jgi:tetratricopeptide (TPR) repeat protein
MSRRLTEYRVFIGSPSGLDKERRRFRNALLDYTEKEAGPRGVRFHPVSWDKLYIPFGRYLQESIDEDIRRSDYAVFVMHNRWGSPSGRADRSRTEAEWDLAKQQHAEGKMRDIALFFKEPGPIESKKMEEEVTKINQFKEQVKQENVCRSVDYRRERQFTDLVTDCLREWLRTIERTARAGSIERRLAGARLLFEKASKYLEGHRFEQAISVFGKVELRYGKERQSSLRELVVRSKFKKASILSQVGRADEEIKIYDEIIGSLEDATELSLLEFRNQASQFKKQTLGELPDEGDEDVSNSTGGGSAMEQSARARHSSSVNLADGVTAPPATAPARTDIA